MVDIKAAVKSATAFATDSLGEKRTRNIRLEEVESSTVKGRPVWLITLSSTRAPLSALDEYASVLGADTGREYKVFTVEKSTGNVLSMKIRLLATPTTSSSQTLVR
jgi:hypothetical protein